MGIKLSKVAKAAKKYDHILIIMRHAKAEPFGDKGDSERELTDKGLKQAKAVGKGIESLGLVPDQISCSSVTRTRQTLDRMLKTFGDFTQLDAHPWLPSRTVCPVWRCGGVVLLPV